MSENKPLPQSVLHLLENSNFLHLGTASKTLKPNVSLMNYTPIPSKSSTNPTILVATSKKSTKYSNLISNNQCSILVHDWITSTKSIELANGEGSSGNNSQEDNLFRLLQSLNQNEISDLSCTLSGHVIKFVEPTESKEFQELKKLHLARNPKAGCFLGDDVVFLLIELNDSKVVDSSNHVRTN
ncbi:unnamed protein product [Ambrosiozyma monospora]|uniref:Unnamed protein product n=1 Tax=Ambrosiozyma monospora TaxID=43982 RepID=A0ACB5SSJ2_AMBMO|nr:unnamed protein product [Ambrosiozyma monospora]